MIVSSDFEKLIFGFKLRYYRNIRKLNLQQLSEKSGISVSYLNEIEKAKKYPSPTKIALLSKALNVDYHDLVSKTGNKKIQPILDIFHSEFFKNFPIAEFGLDPLKLFELLSFSPDKVTAFISTIVKIASNYHLTQENFYVSALRAFQDLHDNYFSTLEFKATQAKKKYFNNVKQSLTLDALKKILNLNWGINLDLDKIRTEKDLSLTRAYYSSQTKTLYVNYKLSDEQLKFILAREFAFQYLELAERPYFTTTLEYHSFEILLNNFRASYFAACLLIDENSFSKDLKNWMDMDVENIDVFRVWMAKYGVSAETLLQRISNIMSGVFGINDLFFIRVNTKNLSDYFITKEIHLSRQHHPHAIVDDNQFCRRWISIKSINAASQSSKMTIYSQISSYFNTDNEYYCISIAKKETFVDEAFSSVTIGFLINEKLKKYFKFIGDPKIKKILVNNTCKTCMLNDCAERIANYEPNKTANRLEMYQKIVEKW